MPKITASNLQEHHDNMVSKIIAASEKLIAENIPLTAGNVASQVGIKRNSLYSYVASVQELYDLVLQHHIDDWNTQLDKALNECTTPESTIITWCRVTLEQVASHQHGQLIQLCMSKTLPKESQKNIYHAHQTISQPMITSWNSIAHSSAYIYQMLTRQLLIGGMQLIHQTLSDNTVATQHSSCPLVTAPPVKQCDDAHNQQCTQQIIDITIANITSLITQAQQQSAQ